MRSFQRVLQKIRQRERFLKVELPSYYTASSWNRPHNPWCGIERPIQNDGQLVILLAFRRVLPGDLIENLRSFGIELEGNLRLIGYSVACNHGAFDIFSRQTAFRLFA